MDYLKLTLIGLWQSLYGIFDKDSFIYKALLAIFLFFTGLHMYVLFVVALVVIDVVTGIMASLKKGIPFQSRKLRRGLLEKLVLYIVMMISVFLLDNLLHSVIEFKSFFFSFFITMLIVLYEVSSILENIYVLRPDMVFLAALVRIFKSMSEKAVHKMEKNIDDVVNAATDVKKQLKDKPADEATPEGEPTDGIKEN